MLILLLMFMFMVMLIFMLMFMIMLELCVARKYGKAVEGIFPSPSLSADVYVA